jgi:DNA excision repair protein ERCC-4
VLLLLLLLLLQPGMIILNAHKVTDSSGEGFAVRLYRQGTGQGLNLPGALGGGGNAAGFLRAFSDSPNAFAAGFNRVEKVRGIAGCRGRKSQCTCC